MNTDGTTPMLEQRNILNRKHEVNDSSGTQCEHDTDRVSGEGSCLPTDEPASAKHPKPCGEGRFANAGRHGGGATHKINSQHIRKDTAQEQPEQGDQPASKTNNNQEHIYKEHSVAGLIQFSTMDQSSNEDDNNDQEVDDHKKTQTDQ